MQLRRKLKHGRGKVRRFVLLRFHQDYVDSQLKNRNGKCRQCGKCCEIMFKCPFFVRDGSITLCSIYEDRPGQCAAFPIDKKCLSDVGSECAYTFGGDPFIAIEPPADDASVKERDEVVERFISTRPIPILLLARLIAWLH